MAIVATSSRSFRVLAFHMMSILAIYSPAFSLAFVLKDVYVVGLVLPRKVEL